MHNTLPAASYTDPAIYRDELERIYRTTWQYVGHVGKLKRAGDFFVCDVAGQSLVILRDRAGEIAAFHNVCAHRAARLLSGEGCKQRITCPYHAWTYDLDGRLLSAPNAANVAGFKVADYRLQHCAVERLHGLIFVNLAQDPEPLSRQAEGLEDELRDYAPDLPALHFVHRTEATLAANWKVAVENFSECYHCQLIHREFVNGVADAQGYRIRVNGRWQRHLSQAQSDADRAYDFDRNRTAHAAEFGAWYLWPNFAFQSYPGGAVHVWKWTPLDEQTTHVAVDWYFASTELADWERELIRHHAATTFAEDIPIVESVQLGLGSQVYDTGPLMIDAEGSVLSEHGVDAIQALWRDAMS